MPLYSPNPNHRPNHSEGLAAIARKWQAAIDQAEHGEASPNDLLAVQIRNTCAQALIAHQRIFGMQAADQATYDEALAAYYDAGMRLAEERRMSVGTEPSSYSGYTLKALQDPNNADALTLARAAQNHLIWLMINQPEPASFKGTMARQQEASEETAHFDFSTGTLYILPPGTELTEDMIALLTREYYLETVEALLAPEIPLAEVPPLPHPDERLETLM